MDAVVIVTGVAVAVVAVAAAGIRLSRRRTAGSPDAVPPDAVVTPRPARAPRAVVVVDTRVVPESGTGRWAEAEGGEPPELAALRLVRESQLVPEDRARYAAPLRALAVPPVGLHRLVSTDVMAAASARELGDLVLAEPRLAARVLARANSAFYGLQSPIKSIPHAITYLGVPAVRSMALALLLAETFPAADPVVRRYHERTWSAALLTADLCSLLSARVGVSDAGLLTTHAVLAHLGDLALPAVPGSRPDFAGELDLVTRLAREQEQLGVSSVAVGTILMQEWRLPAPMIREVEAIGRLVVTPPDSRDPGRAAHRGLVYAAMRIADAIVCQRVREPGELRIAPATEPSLHHLQAYLALPALARLPEILAQPEVATTLARMLAAARTPADAAPAVTAPRATAATVTAA
jgi:HD-like signal output (HDOD) protein